jgi:phosphohistidine phosphatase
MWIYLLRHGVAADAEPGQADADRALTEEGWKRLRRAAPAWRRLVPPPDAVCVSPLRRAQETAQVFVEAVRWKGELRVEPDLVPGAAASVLLRWLEGESLAGTGAIALVGHEPHLGYLLGALLTGHPRQPIPLKKGMLVAVETPATTSLTAELRFVLSSKAAGELA